jgi:hypothetical protein
VSTHIFGVRHHGPGCARSLRAALEALAPDIVLVEGPPDADGALPLLTHEGLQPPVALLIYVPEAPHRAVFYPFTHFSPEWQALRYALERGIPARFMDLPQAVQLAREPEPPEPPIAVPDGEPGRDPAGTPAEIGRVEAPPAEAPAGPAPASSETIVPPTAPVDPIGMLAEAAGYTDHELWWEHQIEQRRDASGLFEAIMEAMAALRDHAGLPHDVEAQREAHMRQTIRAAQEEGFDRVAVVCGGWHAPALADPGSASDDADQLAELKRTKVAATWIPWTNSRLSYRSGYGAGIASPGWYEHLWAARDDTTVRWVVHVAHLLRGEDLDASSASVIEAVRLADALAALRGLPMPGLHELHEAIQTVLCGGDATPMRLIRDRLEIGERLGEVPAETPAVPLQRDLETQQRRLRLRPTADRAPLALDLRGETDRARSQLLHRLRLLGIPWGTPARSAVRALGTFHEDWQIQWQPEFAVKLIEANVWGNTLEAAAIASIGHAADVAADLPQLTVLLDGAILAELPAAVDHLLACTDAQAAVSSDVRHLMDALPPLARAVRYGDVRQTRTDRLIPVIDGLFARALVGLPISCASLDDDAAREMVQSMDSVQESLSLLDRPDQRAEWQGLLRQLATRDGLHGLVRGRCCRLLLEDQVLSDAELWQLARLALSPVAPAAESAAWAEGLLQGSGLLLLHQNGLWVALDNWLGELSPEAFVALLPLLRRAFASFPAPERRAMGERVRRLRAAGGVVAPVPVAVAGSAAASASALPALDHERAGRVLPVLAHILGVTHDANR